MKIAAIVATLLLGAGVSTCQAQVVTAYSPIITSTPHTVYYQPQTVGQPVNGSPQVVTYYQGAPYQTATQPQRVTYQPIQRGAGCACTPAGRTVYSPVNYQPAGYRTVYAYRPIAPVIPMPGEVSVGRGIIGQPTVYVPGQPVRNFLRYLSP